MAKLLPLSVSAPGFLGLNKQNSGDVLPSGWATKADNLVIDSVGRLAKRNGSREQSTTTLSGVDIATTHVYIDKAGVTEVIVAQGNKIYRQTGVGGTFVDITGSITTPTADNWKFQNFNGKVVGWQDAHNPIVMTAIGGTFADIVAGAGVVPLGSTVLAAWGRLWVLDDDTLYYSDLLLEGNWTGGTAGSTSLTYVWPDGTDIPVALAEFNGHLVIFGKESIVIYAGPEDPVSAFSTFTKIEGIAGTGCASRDTVQNVGRDLIWISPDGVKTMGRTIQEKSMPENDAAPHVRDYVVQQAAITTDTVMTSAYAQELGLYVVSFDTTTMAFDLRGQMENGSYKVTEWPSNFRAFTSDRKGSFLFTNKDSGQLLHYTGKLDNVPAVDAGGDNITIDYEGPWGDFSSQDLDIGSHLKMLKKVKLYLFGGSGTAITFKWAVDYSPSFAALNIQVPSSTGSALWGAGLWGAGLWDAGASFKEVKSNVSKSGRVAKFGITASVAGVDIALNRIDLFAKLGKLSL
jgi:hypothetical protein